MQVVISRLHEAKDEGMKKAKFLIGAMIAAFIFVTISYFVPVIYNFPIFYFVGAPLLQVCADRDMHSSVRGTRTVWYVRMNAARSPQSAGMYFIVSPALIGAGVFTGLKNCMFVAHMTRA